MGKFKEFIANEFIDQILEAALALITISFGVNYFLLADSWLGAVGTYAAKSGTVIAGQEANLMFNTIGETFPFNYLTVTTVNNVFLIGVVLLVIGFIIKVITTNSRAELVKDFGKILIVPGVIGLISVTAIQLMTTSSITNLFGRATLRTAESTVANTQTGLLVWNMMGLLFLAGILMLFIGYILSLTVKKLGGKPVGLYLVGEFLVLLGWFSFAFYIVFRLLAIEALAGELYGTTALKLFTLMWYASRSGFIVAVCLFAAGVVLFRYGCKLERTAYGRDKPTLAKVAQKTVNSINPEKKYSIDLYATRDFVDDDYLHINDLHGLGKPVIEDTSSDGVVAYNSVFSR